MVHDGIIQRLDYWQLQFAIANEQVRRKQQQDADKFEAMDAMYRVSVIESLEDSKRMIIDAMGLPFETVTRKKSGFEARLEE